MSYYGCHWADNHLQMYLEYMPGGSLAQASHPSGACRRVDDFGGATTGHVWTLGVCIVPFFIEDIMVELAFLNAGHILTPLT